MPTPKVSVIVPNYNHGRYLAKRIETVLGQTFADFELILMDDCSADDSRAVIERYARKDGRIRTVYNQANSGSTFRQWNKGVREARGEYVWLAESDDYADPDLLRTLLARLQARPNCGIAYCQSWNVDENNTVLGTWIKHTEELDFEKWQTDFEARGTDMVSDHMIYRNIIPNASAVLFRKSVYIKAGCVDESFRLNGDWLLWAKMLLLSDIIFVAQPLNYFRTHSQNVRKSALKGGLAVEEISRVAAHIAKQVQVDEHMRLEIIYTLLKMWVSPMFHGDISLRRSIRIYRNIKSFDNQLNTRLAYFIAKRKVKQFKKTFKI